MCNVQPNGPHWGSRPYCGHHAFFLIIALWWWFCPCRVGGVVWNHTAWLFPLMPLPTESLFYSYFLSGNKYRKTNSTCKNIGQVQFCINLLLSALIWMPVPCLKHWNQDDLEMLHSQYLRENNGTTCHHGHPADCQLALTNVVEVQTKVVTKD